jgi:hypothetical protein
MVFFHSVIIKINFGTFSVLKVGGGESIKLMSLCVILLTVSYSCEIWPVTLKAEHELRVFEKRMLFKVFGTRREEASRK